MGGSERFWLTHPAPRKVREALRKGIVLDIGWGPLKQIGTVGVGQWIEHELLHCGNRIRYAKPFKYLPAYLPKRCRRYLLNVCEEMTGILEAVKP